VIDGRYNDRYVETVKLPANQVEEHPENWRVHPERQRGALDQVLGRVGKLTALQGVRLPDGRIQIFDGHLRRDLFGEDEVRVDIYDLTPEEVRIVLATYDPISVMAEADVEKLESLLADVDMEISEEIMEQLEGLLEKSPGDDDENGPVDPKEYDIDIEDDVEYITCPSCAHRWPK